MLSYSSEKEKNIKLWRLPTYVIWPKGPTEHALKDKSCNILVHSFKNVHSYNCNILLQNDLKERPGAALIKVEIFFHEFNIFKRKIYLHQ